MSWGDVGVDQSIGQSADLPNLPRRRSILEVCDERSQGGLLSSCGSVSSTVDRGVEVGVGQAGCGCAATILGGWTGGSVVS